MKKVLSSLILAFTLLVSAQAFADPSARSMDAIKSKDWQRAEQSLSQDLKENRKDPVAWYFRAQVLNHLQRPDDALKCLDNVVKLDPNFRKDAVDSLRKRLQSNSKIVANSKATGQRVVTESSLERKRAEQNDTYVRNTTVVPAQSVSVSRSEPVSKPVAKTSAQKHPCLVVNNEKQVELYKNILDFTDKQIESYNDEEKDWETLNLLYPTAKASMIMISGSLRNIEKLVSLKDSDGKEDEFIDILNKIENVISWLK